MRHHSGSLLAVMLSASAAALLVPGLARAAAPAVYNLRTLGGRSGGTAINDSGQVTGFSNIGVAVHPFRYTGLPGAGGVMQDLASPGGPGGRGQAITDSGQVAGIVNGPGTNVHAFRHNGTPGSTMTVLARMFGHDYDFGHGINAAGQVTGVSLFTGLGVYNMRAFVYTGTPGSGGAAADLGSLGGGDSSGMGINDAGQVTGDSTLPGGEVRHAFRYTGTPGSGGAMADLGTLGGTHSIGEAINERGQVAGTSDISGDAVRHAFLYTATPGGTEAMLDLARWAEQAATATPSTTPGRSPEGAPLRATARRMPSCTSARPARAAG